MQSFIAVVFVALVLLGMGISLSVASQSTATKYDNVTDTLSSGAINTTLATDNASIEGAYYSDNATVVNASSNLKLSSPSDYLWYNTNGTLKINSQDAAKTTLNVTYDWYERTDTQITITDTVSQLTAAGAYIPFLLIVALLMAILGMMGVMG